MRTEPSHKECLPVHTGPIQVTSYRYEKYEPFENYIFGVPDGWQLSPADMMEVHKRFHELYPNYEDHIYLSKHDIRITAHRMNTNNANPVYTMKNGVELVNDVLDAYSAGLSSEVLTANALRLSEKYGLLTHQPSSKEVLSMEWEEYLDEMTKEGIFQQSPNDYLWFSFSLGEFKAFLIRMRILYLCWRVLYWDVNLHAKNELNVLLDKYSWWFKINKPPQRPPELLTEERKAILMQTLKDAAGIDESCICAYATPPLTAPKQFTFDDIHYRKVIESASKNWTPAITIAFKGAAPTVIYGYDSVMNAAVGCMLNIISLGIDGLELRTMATCSRCNAPFIKKHGRQRFCVDCGSGTVRVREHRERKAKEAENGKKGKQ